MDIMKIRRKVNREKLEADPRYRKFRVLLEERHKEKIKKGGVRNGIAEGAEAGASAPIGGGG